MSTLQTDRAANGATSRIRTASGAVRRGVNGPEPKVRRLATVTDPVNINALPPAKQTATRSRESLPARRIAIAHTHIALCQPPVSRKTAAAG